jgi:hypothetical protein
LKAPKPELLNDNWPPNIREAVSKKNLRNLRIYAIRWLNSGLLRFATARPSLAAWHIPGVGRDVGLAESGSKPWAEY